jgi:hypothetical protein
MCGSADLRLGASFCHSPRYLPVTSRAVGDNFSKLEGLAAFSVVVICASSDRIRDSPQQCGGAESITVSYRNHTAGITRPTAEPHRTRPDNPVISSDHPSPLRRSSNRLRSDPKRSTTHHLSKGGVACHCRPIHTKARPKEPRSASGRMKIRRGAG